MPTPAELLHKLLDYVIEQSKEVDPHGFKLTGHAGFLKKKVDFNGLPGVDFNCQVHGDHIWMRVERLQALPPPRAKSDSTSSLITVSDEPSGPVPFINDAVLNHRAALATKDRTPEELASAITALRVVAERALLEYMPLWRAWSAGEKLRRQTISLYGELFSLKHQLESEQTAKPQELVWGLGVSAWKLDYVETKKTSVVNFQYPLITQAMELAVEDNTLAMVLRPRSVQPRFEFDAFSACQLTSAAGVERAARDALANMLSDRALTPFDRGSFEPILDLVAGNLHKTGRYESGCDVLPVAGDDLLVTDAWVILSRPRSNNFLHEDIERLKNRINAGDGIPAGSLALVTEPSSKAVQPKPISFRGLSGGSGAIGDVRELYFPLSYNHEQVTIIEQLEHSDGVVVQGPPGTGKTHTIANIVCHYLATGRKVLVTSKGEQALEVLQSKIPEEVRPLTVALISGDREGMRQFQSSIEAILHNVSQLNVNVVDTQIAQLKSSIDRAHSELATIDRRVDDIAVAQLSNIEVDGVQMRAQKMAELIITGRSRHSWFDDVLSLDSSHAPPVTGSEVAEAREARRRLGTALVYTSARIPSSLSLPPAADIGQLHDVLISMRDIEEAEAQGELLALRTTTPEVLNEARKLLQSVEGAAQMAQDLEDAGALWAFDLRRKCRLAEFASERQALEALFGEIDGLVTSRAEFLQRPVELSENSLADIKFREALLKGAQTGKPLGMFALGAREVKQYLAAVRVAGLAPVGAHDWKHVVRYAKLHLRVHSFSVRWNQFAELLSIPLVKGSVTALRQIELVTTYARKAHLLATDHDVHLPAMAERVFAKAPVAAIRGTSREMRKVREHLRSHLTRAELARAAMMLATLQEKLAGTTGPVSRELRDFLEEDLGSKAQPTERIVARYVELIAEVRRVESLNHDLWVVTSVANAIEKAGATRLAGRVRSQAVPASGEDTALPVTWRDAWNWARVKTHVDAIEAREELLDLAARRRDIEAGLARLYESMVAKSAWRATKQGANPLVLSALEAYRTAVRKIGQGTGPNAHRYRRDAQDAMQKAQGAVPCWVMSHSKVSETLPAFLGGFDLVVVDESSQSDLWALPAVLRGKKILVVGDDRQVSPDGGFISAIRIQELRDRFLADQPHKASLTPEKSLYDIASTVFAGQKVMLREHFRCVPAIIAYSNRFYDNFMQPLRIPRKSERIDPPLVDIFVPSGYRDGAKDLNRPEAQAILSEIQAILANSQLAGRTLGVVSLLGPDQAKYIDTLVREHCDSAELMRRKFECGDARVFQGSERDIMFLSMVADPKACKALSGNMFEQRFNVAASRARDRMYLVRSVKLSDLSQADLRAGLLQHYSQPLDGTTDEAKSLVNYCESGFERQVYSALFEKGYRIVPQVKAGAFRIDMVVEGGNDTRLAIECDGDEFHGPDRWAADMNRQRVLERAGWTFWRCFASTWSMRKDEVLKELTERLGAMGIEPLGALARIPAIVEFREWHPPVVTTLPGPDGEGVLTLEEAIRQTKT